MACLHKAIVQLIKIIIIIIIMSFTQGNHFNTRDVVINKVPVYLTAVDYNKMNFKTNK